MYKKGVLEGELTTSAAKYEQRSLRIAKLP